MRTFHFKARNIGDEKYLTYTMGEECELDEDVLDYCQDNAPEELIDILYEEDDDYDYLTYQITGRLSLEDYMKEEQSGESVLLLLRNIAQGMISLKEQAIPLSYVLLNRSFMYVDKEKHTVRFLCVPIESKGALAQEFKSFIRQLLANMIYDVDEDLNYVGKLLTYINGSNFNLRGLIGLTEALMEEAGIGFEEAGAIDADGVEVVSGEEEAPAENISDIMNSLGDSDDAPLPEIGDDEEDEPEEEADTEGEEELDSILPAGMKAVAEGPEAPVVDTAEVSVDETVEAVAEEPAIETAESVAEEPAGETAESVAEAPAESEAAEVTATPAEDSPAETAPTESAAVPEESVLTQTAETQPTVSEAPAESEVTGATEPPADNTPVEAEPAAEAPQAEDSGEKLQLKTKKKESDINLIKDRIKELVGEVPTAKQSIAPAQSIQTLEELDQLLDNKPPVVKRNVVKVNRAAIIQQTEAEVEAEAAEAAAEAAAQAAAEAEKEENTTGQTENIKVPVIEDIYEDMNVEKANDQDDKKDDKKAKSTSILNKSVGDIVKEAVNSVATPSVPKALPYLIRESTQERIMLNKPNFRIGKASRGVDYTVGGNGAISRQHAVIIQKDGVCYIKDNKSTNHTYVNGKMIEDGVEEILTHDSVIRLADEEFIFKIR